jgi:hypothetical protein
MKKRNYLIVIALFSWAGLAYSYDILPADETEQDCYGRAMVGLDSVINSRLGVPAEHALELAKVQSRNTSNPRYSQDMLRTILDAYLWEQSPHTYAVKIFYRCAAERGSSLHNARNDWLNGD